MPLTRFTDTLVGRILRLGRKSSRTYSARDRTSHTPHFCDHNLEMVRRMKTIARLDEVDPRLVLA